MENLLEQYAKQPTEELRQEILSHSQEALTLDPEHADMYNRVTIGKEI